MGDEFKHPGSSGGRTANEEAGVTRTEAGAGGSTGGLGGVISSGGVIGTGGVTFGTGGATGGSTPSSGGETGSDTDAGRDAGLDGPAPPECTGNGDCAALACDSPPRCVDGACVLGTCNVADANHCTAECVRNGSAASCIVRGKDADTDGHLDARCAESPGDDCDDSSGSVHAGAPEVCDGLDNDCNGKTDLLDGLLLGGSSKEIKPIARATSARLGLLARASGYLLLTAEAESSLGIGSPSELRYLTYAGDVSSTKNLTSLVDVGDPAMGATSNGALILGSDNLVNVEVVDIYETGSPGTVSTIYPLVKSSIVRGRAAAAGSTSSIAGVWAEDQPASELGGIAGAIFDPFGTPGTLRSLAKVEGATSHAGRPNIVSRGNAGYAVAWVESKVTSGPITVDQVIHLTLTDTTLQNAVDFKLDAFGELPYFIESVRSEVTRPQVVVDQDGTLVVGYLRPQDKIGFVRVTPQGTKLCGPTEFAGIQNWGAAYSMAVTPFGVLFAATNSDGVAELHRLRQPAGAAGQACEIERLGWLNAPETTSVATNRNVDVALGDAAIALGVDGRLGVAWVERTKTAGSSGPSRVMFRTLGPKLCD